MSRPPINPVRNTTNSSSNSIVSNGVNRKFIAILLFFSTICYQGVIAQNTRQEKELNLQSPFGVLEFLHWNHPWNNYKYSCKEDLKKAVVLMKEAGVGWVRMDFLWEEIEPAPNRFEFRKYDDIVDLLYSNNINILGLLNYSAPWASSSGAWNAGPKDNKTFLNYALRVIGRYKDKIKYWEVWNEPDSRTYWSNQDGLKSYSRLLKDVYTAAKKLDPECKILNGGLASGLASVNRLYDNGVKDYFDILNIHIFQSPLNPGAIKAVASYLKLAHQVMARNGDRQKMIWVTEIGCPGVKRGLEVGNWWMGKNPSELKQGKWLKDVYAQLLKNPYVEKIFWAFLRDCKGHWNNGVDYFGLLRWNFSKKPAFHTYQKCVESWRKSQ